VYVLDGIANANGEVGISGSRSCPYENKTFLHAKQGGPKDSIQFRPVHVVNNLILISFHFISPTRSRPNRTLDNNIRDAVAVFCEFNSLGPNGGKHVGFYEFRPLRSCKFSYEGTSCVHVAA
jgi:hypothetical protein